MLKLICGPSGSGKTEKLTEMIKNDIQNGVRCFLIVPEQQAYISERDLLQKLPQNAGLLFEIVHFSGLAEDVFKQYGGVTRVSLNRGIKKLVMWDTLRQLSPLLKRYGKGATQDTTLTSLMVQTVEELRTNGIKGEMLEKIAQNMPTDAALYQKLMDLSLIDAAFHQHLETSFGQDPSDRLIRLAQMLKEHDYFKNSNIYIDSFTSFTAQEYSVIKEILCQAKNVTVSLMTNAYAKPLPHFESTTETAKQLQKLADYANCDVERILLNSENSQKALSLRVIERDLWRFDIKRNERTIIPLSDHSVRMMRCANLYEESEAAALNILELVQGGKHYGDIAVIVRDTESYRGVLDAALERYKIPYFLSDRTDLSSMPLSRLILSALRAISRNYRAQDIITMVKTGLTGVNVKDGAMFEEYCETWHINGNRFTDDVWSMNPDGLTTQKSTRVEEILEAANRSRRILMEPLQKFANQLRSSTKMVDRCRALYDYLTCLKISEQLSERAKAELNAGRRREAGETIRVYQFLTASLTELCSVFPDTDLSIDEFISALTILFAESDIGSVPNLHDCVVIGSASTVRIENNKASIVLGLCEGEFPRSVCDDGLLTEEDKCELEEFGILFDSRSKMRSSEELLYVYRAFTKPSDRLILSTCTHKTDGSELTPSLAFSRVSFLLNREPESFDIDAIRSIIQNQFSSKADEEYFFAPLPEGINLRLSQSKIQTFMLCPYRYYCTYQLKLREKKDSRPSFADDGVFLHYVFEHYLTELKDTTEQDASTESEKIEAIADRILTEYLSEVCPIPQEMMDRQILHLFDRLRKLAVIMLKDILSELKSSQFIPSKFEQIIGLPGENGLPPIILELKNGSKVTLSGMVDRVDLFEKDQEIYVRIVDYKSGVHEFSPEDVRSGLDIQLVLYLLAVIGTDERHLKPAGAQYLYAQTVKGVTSVQRSGFLSNDPMVLDAADQSAEGVYTKKLKKLEAEQIDELFENMRCAVQNAAERIIMGDAHKTPSEKACAFCPVRLHCDKAWHK